MTERKKTTSEVGKREGTALTQAPIPVKATEAKRIRRIPVAVCFRSIGSL